MRETSSTGWFPWKKDREQEDIKLVVEAILRINGRLDRIEKLLEVQSVTVRCAYCGKENTIGMRR